MKKVPNLQKMKIIHTSNVTGKSNFWDLMSRDITCCCHHQINTPRKIHHQVLLGPWSNAFPAIIPGQRLVSLKSSSKPERCWSLTTFFHWKENESLECRLAVPIEAVSHILQYTKLQGLGSCVFWSQSKRFIKKERKKKCSCIDQW